MMTMILRSDLELKYYLGLHNEDLLFTKYSVLYDILEFLIKNKKDSSELKFTSKTLKYIFGEKLNVESLKEKIVSYIKELLDDEYLVKSGESILISTKAITKFYLTND